MYDVQSQAILESSSEWTARDDIPLAYLEAWSYDGTGDATLPARVQSGLLQDHEVQSWIDRDGKFSKSLHEKLRTPKGGFRLLMCERFGSPGLGEPLGFCMTKETFQLIGKRLDLPSDTLFSLKYDSGIVLHSYTLSNDDPHEVKSIEISIKFPQMYEVGSCGMSLTHCFETNTTHAFLHGYNVITEGIPRKEFNLSDDHSSIHRVTRPTKPSVREHLTSTANAMLAHCDHPLILPLMLFQEQLQSIRAFADLVEQRAKSLDTQLGMTLIGQQGDFNSSEIKQILRNESRRDVLTTMMNSTATDAIRLHSAISRSQQQSTSMQRLHEDVVTLRGFDTRDPRGIRDPIRPSVLGLCDEAGAVLNFVEQIKNRTDMQQTVLYNFFNQLDSSLSYQVAAAAGLDSAAMKTLAFVTVLFLPGTFLATLFSMPTFDWRSEGEHPSDRFWIYWAAAMPLTAVIVLGWIFWWKFQKFYFAKEYLQANSSVTTPTMTALVDYLTGGRVRMTWMNDIYTKYRVKKDSEPRWPRRRRTWDSVFGRRDEKLSGNGAVEMT